MSQHKPFDLAIPVGASDHVLGPEHAHVSIVEYGDFECPICKQTAPGLKLLRERFAGQLRFAYRHFPLEEVHPHALAAAEAAECAGAQGKFWEMHDAIFATQDKWATQVTSSPRGVIDPLASQVGLDVARYNECMNSQKYVAHIQAHRQAAQRYRVQSTPSFVIGGRVFAGSLSYDEFKRRVDEARAAAPAPATPGAAPPQAAPPPSR